MSRIGREPIVIPAGVDVKIDGHHVTVKGPKGTLERDVNPMMTLKLENGVLSITVRKRPETQAKRIAIG